MSRLSTGDEGFLLWTGGSPVDGPTHAAVAPCIVRPMTSPFLGSASVLSRQRLRGSAYLRLSRDLYVVRGDGTPLDVQTQVDGALLVFPDAVVCRQTAAALLNLPVEHDGLIHLDRGRGAARSERADIKVHRLGIPDDQCFESNGRRLATGPRLVADLSAVLTLEQLVALGDQVLRRWSAAELSDSVARHGSRRGAALLRQAVPLMDGGSESPAETRCRLRLHAAGFTGLKHGVIVKDADGGWLGQPDLADEVAKLALQYEGADHFEKGVERRRKDVDRDEVVRAHDWEVVAATAIDDRKPDRLIARVTRAYLRQAQLLGPQVLPSHLR